MWPFKRRNPVDGNAMALAAAAERIRTLEKTVSELQVTKAVSDFAPLAVQSQRGQRQKANWVRNRHDFVDSVKGSTYIAIGATARKCAMQKAKVFFQHKEKSGVKLEEVDIDHPLLELFREVNPIHTQFDLWWYTVGFRLSTGDSYWWKVRNSLRRPVELWPLPSTWVWAIPSETEFISQYLVRGVFAEDTLLPADDVIHIREPNLDWRGSGRFYGYPPEAAGADMIHTEEQLFKRVHAELRNFAPPGMVFETDKSLTWEQLQDIYNQIVTQHSLAEHAGRPMATHSGMKGKVIETRREANWFESLDFALSWDLSIFGTPKAAVGLVQDVNRANYFAAILSWIENVITPLLVHTEQHLTQRLARDYDPNLIVKFDSVKVNDAEQIRKDIDTMKRQGDITPNEVREILGDLPPFVEGGDRPLVQQNMVPAPHGNDELPEEDDTPPPPPPRQQEEEPSESVDEQEKRAIITKTLLSYMERRFGFGNGHHEILVSR